MLMNDLQGLLRSPAVLILLTLTQGCTFYDRDFQCPARSGGRCQPIERTYEQMLDNQFQSVEFRLIEVDR